MPKSKTNGRTPDISMDEWMEEMERLGATGANDEGLTMHELNALTDRSPVKIKDYLREMQTEGRLIVGRRSITRIDGAAGMVPVYSIKPKK